MVICVFFLSKKFVLVLILKVQHINTELAQTLTGPPIRYHLVIVVLGKVVGLGYALAPCSDPWYICIFFITYQFVLVDL